MRDYKVDKSSWVPGPWHSEPDILQWDCKGVTCLIVRSSLSGAFCGYIGLAKNHPTRPTVEDGYDNFPYNVHGGITYSRASHADYQGTDDLWWIGFDCAHCEDQMPAFQHDATVNVLLAQLGNHYWTLAEVKVEVEDLADQVLQLAVS